MKILLKNLFTVILFFAYSFTFPDTAFAATLEVCPSGCQYSTIQSAVTAAATGDTVMVNDGTYSGFNISKQITVSAKNFNQNNPSSNPVTVNGQVTSSGGSSWAYNSGPTVRGFRIIGGTDPVVMNASPMTIEYNFIKATGGDAVSFEGGGGIVRGNRIEGGGDDGVDIDHAQKNIIIENNYIFGSRQDGIEHRQQADTLSNRILISVIGNRIEGSREDGYQIMDYANFSNRAYRVERNLFLNNQKAAIGINAGENTSQTYTTGPMPEPLYAVNNTFVGNDAGISGGSNLIAINNIFSGQNTFDLKNVMGLSKVMRSVFAVNPRLVGTNNLDNSTTVIADPRLNSNYELLSGSPAIDRGITTYQHSYSYNGSGGGSAQTITEYVINLSSNQYSGNAPDLGWRESGLVSPPSVTVSPVPTSGGNKPGDCDGDGFVDLFDYGYLSRSFGLTQGQQGFDGRCDFHVDQFNIIDLFDYQILANNFGR